jgi:hypothetical protein
LVQASPADLAALASALAPVYARLRADARTSAWLDRIRSLKDEVRAPPDTQSCPGTAVAASSPLDGTWEKRLTAAEAGSTGCTPDVSKAYVAYRLVVGNGRARIMVSVDGAPAKVGWDGTVAVFKDRVRLTDPEGGFTVAWSVTGDRLTLSDMTPSDCGGAIVWTLHPWQRVG